MDNLDVDPFVVSIHRDELLQDDSESDENREIDFGPDSDDDQILPNGEPQPDRGVYRSLEEAFGSDSDSDDEPPTRRIRTEGALYDWTGGNP